MNDFTTIAVIIAGIFAVLMLMYRDDYLTERDRRFKAERARDVNFQFMQTWRHEATVTLEELNAMTLVLNSALAEKKKKGKK